MKAFRMTALLIIIGVLLAGCFGKEKVPPTPPPKTVLDTFENANIGEVPEPWFITGTSSAAEYKVVTDPLDAENQVLLIDKSATDVGFHVQRSFDLADGGPNTTVGFRFMVPAVNTGNALNFNMGQGSSGVQRA